MVDDKNSLLDKTMALAIATPAAYLLAYEFDVGYLDQFGIPPAFVDVGIKDLLFLLAAVVSGVYAIYVLVDGLLIALPGKWPTKVKVTVGLLVAALLGLFNLVKAYNLPRWAWVSILAILALIALVKVLFPLWNARKPAPADLTPRADPSAPRGAISLMHSAGWPVSIVYPVFLLICLAWTAQPVGGLAASMTKDFLVFSEDTGGNCVIVKKWDNKLICAEFESAGRKLTGKYRLLDPSNVELARMEAGPLERPSNAATARSNDGCCIGTQGSM